MMRLCVVGVSLSVIISVGSVVIIRGQFHSSAEHLFFSIFIQEEEKKVRIQLVMHLIKKHVLFTRDSERTTALPSVVLTLHMRQ